MKSRHEGCDMRQIKPRAAPQNQAVQSAELGDALFMTRTIATLFAFAATAIALRDFQSVTGEAAFPPSLAPHIRDGQLDSNGSRRIAARPPLPARCAAHIVLRSPSTMVSARTVSFLVDNFGDQGVDFNRFSWKTMPVRRPGRGRVELDDAAGRTGQGEARLDITDAPGRACGRSS